jgi:S1-C subfamily serine protease
MLKKIVLSLAGVFFLGEVSLVQSSPEIKKIIAKVAPSVVRVEAKDGKTLVATGVIFDKEGHIVTTSLVTLGEKELTVVDSQGEKYQAEIIGKDWDTSLAVVRCKEKLLNPIAIAEKGKPQVGDWIAILGISPEDTPSIFQGIISSVSGEYLRLNIWVVPGLSGAPVVNKRGELIGILRGAIHSKEPCYFEFESEVGCYHAIMSRSRLTAPPSGLGMAVPINIVKETVQEIITEGEVKRGWLGITIFDNKEDEVEIRRVLPNSPADKVGLEVGDIILRVAGKRLRNTQQLLSIIKGRKPGEKIELEIKRDNKKVKVYPKLETADRGEEYWWGVPFIEPWEFMGPRGHKRIGIRAIDLTEELAKHFGVKNGKAVLVSLVAKRSPAEKAGLRVGDVIYKADSERIESTAELSSIIASKKAGQRVKLELLRDKKPVTVNVKVKKQVRFNYWNEYYRPFFERWRDWGRSFQKGLEKELRNLKKGLRKLEEKLKSLKKRPKGKEI